MNKIAVALYSIGVLNIIGGIILGSMAYNVPVEGYHYLTEEDPVALMTWIAAGLFSGVLLFGFAEIVKILDEKKSIVADSRAHLEHIKSLLKEAK